MTMTPEEKLPPVSQAQPPENLALAREIALQKARRGHESPGTIQMLEAAYRNGKMDNTETVTVALLSIQATEARMQERVRAETEKLIYKVLRDYRLTNIGQEDEPSEGYPLVDAVSTPDTDISTGEEQLGEIAYAIAAAIRETPHAEG